MFERFTQDARRTVVGAVAQAEGSGSPEITRTHLLLAMLAEGGAVAEVFAAHGVTARTLLEPPPDAIDEASDADDDAQALASLGIDLDAVRRAVEVSFGAGALDRAARDRAGARREAGHDEAGPRGWWRRRSTSASRPFSGGAKKTLELALREAIRLGSKDIRSEHLALGLLRDPGAELQGALERLGASSGVIASDLEGRLQRSA